MEDGHSGCQMHEIEMAKWFYNHLSLVLINETKRVDILPNQKHL